LFTYEEMYTCLTLIEACLNSRPITPLSSNPDDLSPLTPGHFLIGTALTAPAESDVTEINIHRLDQWQKIQQVRQHFWKRWCREYIVELQQRSKWATSTRPAAVGDIVIVHEDNIPPLVLESRSHRNSASWTRWKSANCVGPNKKWCAETISAQTEPFTGLVLLSFVIQ
jgi:hypothetical protein